MTEDRILRSLINYGLLVLAGVIMFVAYHYVVFPLFLDYGVNGIYLTLVLLGILVWLIPRDLRLVWAGVGLGYLLVVRALYNINYYKPLWYVVLAWLVLMVVWMLVLKILAAMSGKHQQDQAATESVISFSWKSLVVLGLVALILPMSVSESELFFNKHFKLVYQSPKLFDDTNVDYFPLEIIDVDGDGVMEVVTQGLPEAMEADGHLLSHIMGAPGRSPMQIEPNRYLVYQYQETGAGGVQPRAGGGLLRSGGGRMVEIGNDSSLAQALVPYLNRDYVGFPYYLMTWAAGDSVLEKYKDIRISLLENGFLCEDCLTRVQDRIDVDSVDNLGISLDELRLLYQAFAGSESMAVNYVDNFVDFVDGSVDKCDDRLICDEEAGLYEILVPMIDRVGLIEDFLPFGETAWAALDLTKANIAAQKASWEAIQVQAMAATGSSVGYSAEADTETADGSLGGHPSMSASLGGVKVRDVDRLPAWVRVHLSANDEVLLADIDGDGTDEILVSGTPSRILKLVAGQELVEIWVAGDDVFRFETVTADGTIIGNANSYKRAEAKRYLTGYRLVADNKSVGFKRVAASDSADSGSLLAGGHIADGQSLNLATSYALAPMWRTSNTVINVRSGDVTGDGADELVAALYKDHAFVVLEEHGIPVTEIAWGMLGLGYLLVEVYGYNYRRKNINTNNTNQSSNNQNISIQNSNNKNINNQNQNINSQNQLNNQNSNNQNINSLILNKLNNITSSNSYLILTTKVGVAGLALVLGFWSVSDNTHYSATGGPVVLASAGSISSNSTDNATDIDRDKLAADGQAESSATSNLTADGRAGMLKGLDASLSHKISEAITYTNAEGKRFWYSGWVASKVQKRQTNSMYDGVIVREDADGTVLNGGLVNARLLGQPFNFYRNGDDVYLREDDVWRRLRGDGGMPVDRLAGLEMRSQTASVAVEPGHNGAGLNIAVEPFAGLERLLDLATYGLEVVEDVRLDGSEMILASMSDRYVWRLRDVESGAIMDWSIWIGQDEPFINQYNVETVLPVPGAGDLKQTTYFRFWKYNDQLIKLTDVAAIERQIVSREEALVKDIDRALAKGLSIVNAKDKAKLGDYERAWLELRLEVLRDNLAASKGK